MNVEVQQEIRNAAHLAHTFSRLAVDYDRMAHEMPWKRDKFLAEAEACRGQGWQWIDHAKDLKARYSKAPDFFRANLIFSEKLT